MEARITKLKDAVNNRELQIRAFEDMHEEVRRQEAEKRRLEQIELTLKKVPLRYRGKCFNDYSIHHKEQERVKNISIRFMETISDRLKDGTCLIMSGRPGTGKTLLALILFQELAKKGIAVLYESSLDWIGALIHQKYHATASYCSNSKIYESVSLLILDEITESLSKDGAPTEVERQMIFQIINKRYENNLCTVVITNRDEQTLVKRLGQPTVDRLQENGISLAFEWDSFRQR